MSLKKCAASQWTHSQLQLEEDFSGIFRELFSTLSLTLLTLLLVSRVFITRWGSRFGHRQSLSQPWKKHSLSHTEHKLILGSLERIVSFIREAKVWCSSPSDCSLEVLEGLRLPLAWWGAYSQLYRTNYIHMWVAGFIYWTSVVYYRQGNQCTVL